MTAAMTAIMYTSQAEGEVEEACVEEGATLVGLPFAMAESTQPNPAQPTSQTQPTACCRLQLSLSDLLPSFMHVSALWVLSFWS